MAGPAIRAWEIARALAGRHDVVLATTTAVCERAGDGFRTEAAGPDHFSALEAWCDVAIVQGYVLEHVPVLKATEKVLAVDLYDPIFLEDLELNRAWPEPDRSNQINNVVRVFNEQAARGDFFLCASEKQRDMWLGYLAAMGRISPAPYAADPTLRALIDVAAFGLPDHPAVASGAPAMRGAVDGIGPADDVVLWGGGVYDWLDPVTAIRAVDQARRTRPAIRLFFMGVKHPNPAAEESRALGAARAEAESLGLTGTHVFFNEGWVPYERRADYLLEADVGISLHTEHVETAYSFRTRILDCIWTGLPTVATEGDTFAELIGREGLGAVVAGGDVDAVSAALIDLLEDRGRRDGCRARAAGLVPEFAWSKVLEPLVRFCDHPVRAADHVAPAPPPASDLRSRVAAAYRRGGARALAGAAYRAARRRI